MRRTCKGMTMLGALAIAAAAQSVLAASTPFVAGGNKDLGRPGDDPAAAGSYSVVGNVHTVIGGGSDWWDGGEYGHVAYALMPAGEFRLESTISALPRFVPSDPSVEFDYWVKAGVFLRNDVDNGAGNEKEVNAIMAALRSDRNDSAFQYRPGSSSNMTNMQLGGPNAPQKVALQRRLSGGQTLLQGLVSYDGSTWVLAGQTVMNSLAAQPYGGLAVTAHRNSGTGNLLSVDFTSPTISDTVVNPVLPAMRSVSGLMPVAGFDGMWAIREVQGNPNQSGVGNLANVVNSLNNPAGNIEDYKRPWINISDPNGPGNGRVSAFPGNERYQVQVTGKVPGAVDNISMAMAAKIDVPATGWYTFDVASDDGFELAVDGGIVMQADYGKGDSSVLGYAYLTKGVHDLRVLYWEGGGGAGVEVRSAPGIRTDANDSAFGLVGHPGVEIDYVIPGMKNVNTKATRSLGGGVVTSRDTSLAMLAAGDGDGSNSYGTADRVNHGDPQNGGGGSYRQAFNAGNRLAFPNNTTADDNDFAFMAEGKLVIPTTGTYYIGFESDDGAALQILGQTWLEVVENWTGGGKIDPADASWLMADVWTGNSHTVGKINLAAGEYDFKFVSYEGGGGAFATVFGSSVQGLYDVIMGDARNLHFSRSAGLRLAVPEPGTLGLLALGGLGLLARRRKA